MQLQILAGSRRVALLAAAVTAIACGGGPPAADSATSASPVARDANVPGDSLVPGGASVSSDSLTPDGASISGNSSRVVPAGAPQRGRDTAIDTVRGIVSQVGSVPMLSVIVQPSSGAAVTITGALAQEIGRAVGADVQVSGRRDGRSLDAVSYAVRTVDGEKAIDGILAMEADRLVLVTGGGRRHIARPLQALRGMIGARVWLVGPLDGTITSYGVLREP